MPLIFNPRQRGFYNNPRPIYKRMRDESPAHWSPDLGWWALSRYDDVRDALRNWKVFSAAQGTSGSDSIAFADYPFLLMMDPPRHTHLRKVASALLTPDKLLALEASIREQTNAIFDRFQEGDEMDLTQDFAALLPAQVIQDILGLPRQDASMLTEWVDTLAESGENHMERLQTSIVNIRDYYVEKFRERVQRTPGDDIVWHLMDGVRQGIMEEREAIGFGIIFTIAGSETTTKMIGNMAWLLHQYPKQRQLLLANPELLHGAVEEALRYNSTTHIQTRTLSDDLTLHGKTLKKGDTVALLFNSANNDERKFEDPDRFDITREPTGDFLAFGGGIHACLGAPLARLEIRVAMEELLKRRPSYEIITDRCERYFNPFTQGYRKLPIKLR